MLVLIIACRGMKVNRVLDQRSGPVYIVIKQSRLRFKSALKYCKANKDAMRSNAFAKSLMDKDMNSLWRGITKVNNAKIP